MGKKLIIILTVLLFLLTLSGCFEINPPPAQSTPSSIAPSKPEPQYHTVTFDLDEDNSEYTFPIYLHNNETLHMYWWVEGSESDVWFHIFTPSGQVFGFYDNEGNFANSTLAEGFTRGMTEGITQFSPSDYGWGEGYYTMSVNDGRSGLITVRVEWWIEE